MDEEKKFIEGVWAKINEQEKAEALINALERKEKNHMLIIAKDFLTQLGLKGLVTGMADVVAVSMVIAVCTFIGIYIYLGFDSEYVYSMLFIFSPTLYASIFCLSYLKEMQTHTFDVQMSCRYTFFHVLVFRMLLNSGLAIVFNAIYIFTLNSMFALNPLKALVLSFSSLMFFSVLLLQTLKRRNKIVGFMNVNALWFGVNLIAFNGIRPEYTKLLNQIPLGVSVISIVLCLVLYYKELKQMLSADYKRRYSHA